MNHPTDLFTNMEPQNPGIDKLYVVRKRQSTDFEALKLGKGRLGNNASTILGHTAVSPDRKDAVKIATSRA